MYVSDIIQIIILGYALGGIPFGVLLAKLFHLPDPRYIGSGNIGATNMLRTGNKKVALLTLLLDAGKGAMAVAITQHLFLLIQVHECITPKGAEPHSAEIYDCEIMLTAPHYAALAVLAAALGHMASPWLKFKGGKGMATILGGTLAFSWPVGMATLLTWLMVVFVTRYVSLGSILALIVAALVTWLRVDATSEIIIGIASAIAIWKHRSNMARLRQGFEPRVQFGKSKK